MVRLREVVSALLVTPDGKLLIQQRDDNPTLPYPDQWTPFGGQVEPGETPRAAVRRELWEELELDLPLMLWKTYVDPNRTQGDVICMHYSFFATLDRDPATLTQHEGQGRAAFTLDELRGLTVAFGQGDLLVELMERYDPPPLTLRGGRFAAFSPPKADSLSTPQGGRGTRKSPSNEDFWKFLSPLVGERDLRG